MPLATYSPAAIARARQSAMEWLDGNEIGYPRTWEQERIDAERLGYEPYDDADWEAPPIAGYEALESDGLVERLPDVMKGSQKRAQFRRTWTPIKE